MTDLFEAECKVARTAADKFLKGDTSPQVVDRLILILANRLSNYLYNLDQLKKEDRLPDELEFSLRILSGEDYDNIQEVVCKRHPDWKGEADAAIEKVLGEGRNPGKH